MAYKYEGEFVSLLDRLDAGERNFIFSGIDDELKEVYAKAKAFNDLVSFVREQHLRANQNYGFVKFFGKSKEELKQAGEELLKLQEGAMIVCNVLGITLEEFIISGDK